MHLDKLTDSRDFVSEIFYSVVICTWNRSKFLRQTLKGLKSQNFDTKRFEIIVVDNASTDDTAASVENLKAEMPGLRYIHESQQGLSYARNTGTREAHGDVVCFLDDDAIPSVGWLAALDGTYRSFPNAGAVGGRIIPIWGAARPQWLGGSLLFALSALDHGPQDRPEGCIGFLIGANISYLRKCLVEVGGFQPALGRTRNGLASNEETLVNQLLLKHGYPLIYCGKAAVEHHIHANRINISWFMKRFYAEGITDLFLARYWGRFSLPYWMGRIGFASARAFLQIFLKLIQPGGPSAAVEPFLTLARQAGRIRGLI